MPRYYGNQNAGVGLSLFSPTFRANTPFVDLSVVQNTYNTLEQGHHQAIAQAAAYKEALAQMDLNEAEDGWRQQLIDEIDSALTNNTQYGNSYAALDDIVKTYGNIKGNAGLIGRLRAQQQYKTYLDELSKSDLTEEQKDYFKEMNPYYYQDKIDNKGRVIGGTSWKPIEQYVDNVDQNKIISDAIRSLTPDSSEGESIWFGDKDGRGFTQSFEDSDGIPYFKKGNSYTRVSQDRIQSAIDAAIENTPGARASLMQDYKIAKWRHGKQPTGTVDDTTDDNGNSLNYEQYLQKRFKGYLHSRTYNQTKNTIGTEAGMSAQLLTAREKAKAAASGGTGAFDAVIQNAPSTPGASVTWKNSQIETAIGTQLQSVSNIRNLADQYKIQYNPKNIEETIAALKAEINKNPDDTNVVALQELIDQYRDSSNRITQILEQNPDDETKQALDMMTAINLGLDLSLVDNDNKFKKEYDKVVKEVWKGFGITDNNPEAEVNLDADYVRNHIPNHDQMGLHIKTKNGKEIVTLTKDSYDYLPQLAQAFGQLNVLDEGNGNIFRAAKVVDDETVPIVSTTNYFKRGETGLGLLSMISPIAAGLIHRQLSKNPLYKIQNFTENLSKGIDNVNNGLQTITGTDIVAMDDMIEPLVKQLQADATGEWADVNNADKEAKKLLNGTFGASQGSELTMYVGKNGSRMAYVDDPVSKNSIWDFFKFVDSRDTNSKPLIYKGFDKTSGFNYLRIQVPNKASQTDDAYDAVMKNLKNQGIEVNPGEYITLMVDNVANSRDKQRLLNFPIIKYNMKLAADAASGIHTYNNDDGSIINFDGRNYTYRMNARVAPDNITKEQAAQILAANEQIKNLKYLKAVATRSGNGLTKEQSEQIAISIAQYLKSLGYKPNDISYVPYFNQIADIIDNYNFN